MPTNWTNQVALVTGGARGLGRATVKRLAAHGVAVAINYASKPETADALAAEVRAAGGCAITVCADVANAPAVNAMAAPTEAEAELGPMSTAVGFQASKAA
jgi:3-oxoacyl-[acyl-carrier protein] reductase